MQVVKHASRQRGNRNALATVELAVCLPVIMVLVFAAIECCSMIFVDQAIHAATYEGARAAIQNSSDAAKVQQRAQQVLEGHGIVGATISCEPANVAAVANGETITVVVSVPCDANRISPVFFLGNRNLEARTTMAKE
jgi:Flp pilus assembly protein TadG